MKIVLALAGALALAGCAAAGKPAATSGASAVAKAGTYYCWRDKLATEGDNLVCNWESDRHDACEVSYSVTIKRSNVSTGPSDAGRCQNGQWLVMVTTR
jgi:hypothetical protein